MSNHEISREYSGESPSADDLLNSSETRPETERTGRVTEGPPQDTTIYDDLSDISEYTREKFHAALATALESNWDKLLKSGRDFMQNRPAEHESYELALGQLTNKFVGIIRSQIERDPRIREALKFYADVKQMVTVMDRLEPIITKQVRDILVVS